MKAYLLTKFYSEHLNPPGRKRRRNQSAQDVNPPQPQKQKLPQAPKPSHAKPPQRKSPLKPKNVEVPKVVQNGHVKKLVSTFQGTIDLTKSDDKKSLPTHSSPVLEPIATKTVVDSPGLGFVSRKNFP